MIVTGIAGAYVIPLDFIIIISCLCYLSSNIILCVTNSTPSTLFPHHYQAGFIVLLLAIYIFGQIGSTKLLHENGPSIKIVKSGND